MEGFMDWNKSVLYWLQQIYTNIKTLTVASPAATYTVLTVDDIILASGTFTVTLLTIATALKKPLTITNVGAGVITIDGASAEKINGESTYELSAQYESVTIYPSTTEWNIIAKL